MVRPAVVVGYPRIDLALVLCLIGSGPSFVNHLVVWFARVLLLNDSVLLDSTFPPRMYPPIALLTRSFAYYYRTTSIVH